MRSRLVVGMLVLLVVALVPGLASAACDDFGMTRGQVAYVLACGLAGGEAEVPAGPATPSYPDVPTGLWAFRYVEYVEAKHVMSGYSDATFKPGAVVTRDAMAVYLARSIADPTGDAGLVGYTPPATPSFSDVSTDYWAYMYIEYLKSKGIVAGDAEGKFHPGDPLLASVGLAWVNAAFSADLGLTPCELRKTDFAAAPVSGPVPLAVVFTDHSQGVLTSWSWDFGDGGASTAQNPSHTYTVGGTYSVTLTTANAGGTDTCAKSNLVMATLPVPTITDVQIDRGRDADWWDWSVWHTRYVVQVQGTAGEQPAQLWLQDMQGCRQVIQTDGKHWYDPAGTNPGGSWEDARVIAGPNYTYTYVWYEARQALPIPAGSYTLTVIGSAGSQTSLTTATFPAVPDAVPALIGPADQSVSTTAAPTFQWSALSGTKATLQVRAEGDPTYTGPAPDQDDCGQIWRVPVTGLTSVQYNSDAKGPALQPGRTYYWQVNDWTPVDDRASDPRVSVWNSQTAHHRFTVDTTWPALPALPGRLAYQQTMYGDGSDPYNVSALLQYGTTPAQRTWVGPDSAHTPSYSWDGTKVAYRLSDWGVRVSDADGSDSVGLPGSWSWDSSDFSPDATWVAYCGGEVQGSSPQHVYLQKLFETTRTLLVRARGDTTRGARWSPDGVWISYESCCDPSGNNVWLIHPDGTGDHPLLPTGVAGYPGATGLRIAGKPVWSPDAARVGVAFSLKTSTGTDVSGLGTISRDGGEITPVWINPPGYVCCASAGYGMWSPDGQYLVFNSAHHLPVDPGWKDGKLEHGVELWMIKADGTGAPTRLTYDYSYSEAGAWWAPNTPVGEHVAITKGSATVAFDQVTTEGSTAVFVATEPPGPAPDGYELLGRSWKLLSTAAHADDLDLELHYADVVVPTGSVRDVRLLAREGGAWSDVTQALDWENRIVTGRATNPTSFTLARSLHSFSDVSDTFWASDAVTACVDAGIVSGYSDGTYRPDQPVTRDQMAVYISRALAGGDALVPTGPATASFTDVDTGNWAFRYVEYAKGRKIVTGYSDNTYRPTQEVTRDQMAVYISRAVVQPTGDDGLASYTPPTTASFADVPVGFWAYRYIEYAKSQSIVKGYDDGYRPTAVVTRDQMAVYVARAFKLE